MATDSAPAGANAAVPDRDTQIEMYRRMSLISQNDEAARRLVHAGWLMMPTTHPGAGGDPFRGVGQALQKLFVVSVDQIAEAARATVGDRPNRPRC